MLNWLLEPFQYTFMQLGLTAAALVGLTCAAIGVYVVLRRMAFIGDALAHTVLPGLVIAYLNSWNLVAGATVAGLATALLIGWLAQRQEIREDTAIGIVFTGMFALGILLMSTVRSFRDFSHILFGNVLGVTMRDLVFIGGVAVVVFLVLALLHKELELASVDPDYATAIGLPVDGLRYLLLGLLALAVVSAIQAVGVVLTSALLVTPAATASLLTQRLAPMMAVSGLFAVGAGVAGLYTSYYASVSSGAAIVLVSTLAFVIVWLARRAE